MKNLIKNYYNFAVSDFDGTLLRTDMTVSDFTLKTIRSFIARGGMFTVCTGRMTAAILPHCRKMGFNSGYVISYNGAEICDLASGEKLFKNHISNADCVNLLQYAEKCGYEIFVYPNDTLTVQGFSERSLEYADHCKIDLRYTGSAVSEFFKRTGFTSGKALFHTGGSEEIAKKIVNDLTTAYGDRLNVIMSNVNHVDVMVKGASKGSAVLKLCELANANKNKLVCFGDESNDLSMLNEAALSVVTANGNPAVKQVADLITDDCDHDGVAKAMLEYCV